MIDHAKGASVCVRGKQKGKGRVNALLLTKLESMTARSYADDRNILRGGLSAPKMVDRPGSRDDGLHCLRLGVAASL